MQTVRQFYLRYWRGIALDLSLIVIAILLYFPRLSSLVPGYSTSELNAYANANNWHTIVSNPINAPYKVFVWLFSTEVHHSIFITRAVSASFALILALLFFIVVRTWYTYRAALLSTIIFMTSAGLLHFARLGTGDILQMSILALLGAAIWYRTQRKHRVLISYLLVALVVLLLYIPGMFWFELLGLILLRATVIGQLRRTKTLHLAGLALVFLVCLAPLVRASLKHPIVLRQLSGLPQSLSTLKHFGSNLWNLILAIVVHGNGNPLLWVGHAPLLNTVEVIIGVLGAVYIYRGTSKRCGILLFGWLGIGLVLVSLGGSVSFACLVPLFYLFIGNGIDHLLSRWLTVFPRNPIARMTGVGIICVMLGFSVLYQLRTYYVAWPNAPATRTAFSRPAP
jgi:hypothetical protein